MNTLFKVYNNETKNYIENYIITPMGKIYSCSQLGDEINPDEYFANNSYLDSLDIEDVTDKVELIFPN